MTCSDELSSFIAASFRSVWAIELLLLLKREDRACEVDELVTMLRASPEVVARALETLVAAGLAGNQGATARYIPVSERIAALVEEAERFYGSHPDRVRRII